ncbi:MAG: tRNA 2-thiocytidine biosynthesis TtcA family protein [Christensenellales bacterium]|jgi:tRNA 2-thiocytidine biosynthesis protein TtcA
MHKISGAVTKAMYDFNMIEDGDKIAVGVSGGKDSLALLSALSYIKKFYDRSFDLIAIHIDMGFEKAITDFDDYYSFIKALGVELIIEKTRLYELIFKVRKEKNPCSLCSNMRRGALNSVAVKAGCNKLALGHHSDDLIETFFLSLIYESRLSTFKPVSYLDRAGITVIRPLIYLSESKITSLNLPSITSPCPANKNTKRQYIKELLSRIYSETPKSRERILNAVIHPERNNLWGLADFRDK